MQNSIVSNVVSCILLFYVNCSPSLKALACFLFGNSASNVRTAIYLVLIEIFSPDLFNCIETIFYLNRISYWHNQLNILFPK